MTAGLLFGILFAQDGPPSPTTDNLRRIRSALERSVPVPPVSASTHSEGPVFRVKVEAIDIGTPWKERSIVPGYVRSSFTPYHYELLHAVTPEDFRSGTLYPGALGLPIVPMVEYLGKAIAAARRASQQGRARETVRKDLERFLACRDAAKPGCTRH